VKKYPEIPFFYSSLDYFFVDAQGTLCPTQRGWDSPLIPLMFHGLPDAPVPTVLVKKDVLAEVGYFNPSLHIGESWEMFARIAKQYPIFYIPESLARQRKHPGQITGDASIRAKRRFVPQSCFFRIRNRIFSIAFVTDLVLSAPAPLLYEDRCSLEFNSPKLSEFQKMLYSMLTSLLCSAAVPFLIRSFEFFGIVTACAIMLTMYVGIA